ncbi:hypothetical protein [Microvirga lotononidis]|uniref:Uncharacterized protein n=1 Tax=Microvirga lotononidis TaxID=864069 RepID=I4YV36_9HYPH|nr:hypothetical protein [Microvirga lotononidis]EIM27828.1 hypothetical protein MicloDRAFT_00044020 [Microvirga lotononidis]WQO28042.1 hypothetical protein U0023_02745 [Microvirga lotononidis]
MTRFALTASLLLLAGPGFAQDAPDGQALQLTVRPSGFDAEANEATERQQRLLKRLEQSNHMMRSICINCGDSWKHQIYAPFNPLAALGGRSEQPSEEAGN